MNNKLHTILLAILCFTLVTLIAYSSWAFRLPWIKSEITLYLTCTIIFFSLGAVSLYPLVKTTTSFKRFAMVFFIGFIAYAICWCLSWMTLYNKVGELGGSLLGLAAMIWIFQVGLGRPTKWWLALPILFLTHTIGYHLGEWIHAHYSHSHTSLARLGWGLFHGLGFGTGLAIVLSLGGNPAPEKADQAKLP
ncbi:MAG: hypothetical protein KDN19_09005 [Verrucomicrobiae bacterium]|nr:hypothetical protein [Verrucomicrobiae bacterium]